MEGICIGKGIVIGINLVFGLFGYKQGAIVCTIKLQKNKEVSAVLLHGTLHINWWDDDLLEVLVVL